MLSVYNRQRNLKAHCGYYNGNFDGVEGEKTKKAYRNFQNDNHLEVDGKYGSNTDAKLIAVIRNLQHLLNKYGYGLDEDGVAGDKTINSIINFQKSHNLTADGIAGASTYNVLNGSAPQPTPTPTPSKYKCKYFEDKEFNCPCCGKNIMKNGIKQIADQIREHFGKPAIISSGTRCEKHNREVGGVAGSYHTTGNAIDIVIPGVPASSVLAYCRTIVASGKAGYTYGGTTQMGNATHIDTRGKE